MQVAWVHIMCSDCSLNICIMFTCECFVVHAFYVNRIMKLWNELPQSTNFSTLTDSTLSITDDFLIMKCSGLPGWLSWLKRQLLCMFICAWLLEVQLHSRADSLTRAYNLSRTVKWVATSISDYLKSLLWNWTLHVSKHRETFNGLCGIAWSYCDL